MSARNTDSSTLTARIQNKANAAFANQQKVLANPSGTTTQPLFIKTNPQTGIFTHADLSNTITGSATQYERAYGVELIDSACGCKSGTTVAVPLVVESTTESC